MVAAEQSFNLAALTLLMEETAHKPASQDVTKRRVCAESADLAHAKRQPSLCIALQNTAQDACLNAVQAMHVCTHLCFR